MATTMEFPIDIELRRVIAEPEFELLFLNIYMLSTTTYITQKFFFLFHAILLIL